MHIELNHTSYSHRGDKTGQVEKCNTSCGQTGKLAHQFFVFFFYMFLWWNGLAQFPLAVFFLCANSFGT